MSARTIGGGVGLFVAACGVAVALLAGACTPTGSVESPSSTAAIPSLSRVSSSSPVAGEVAADVVLVPDPECRNGGTAMVGRERWHVLVRQPAAWRDEPQVVGTLEVRGERGLFTDGDDHTIAVTRGPVEAMCDVWPED